MTGSCEWFAMHHDEIVQWADAHRDSLPSNLEELARYPMPFRRVIVNMIPSEVRAAMWCDHLGSFLGPGSELSSDEQAFLRDLIVDLPAAFVGPAHSARERFVAFSERLKGRFAPALAARLFMTIGPPEPPGGLPLPADVQLSR